MNKTALITGWSRGIGKWLVLELLKQGYNVASLSKDPEQCDKLTEECKTLWYKSIFISACDITNEYWVKKFVEQSYSTFWSIDIVINNAWFGYFCNCDEVDIDYFNTMLHTNVTWMGIMCKYSVPYMKKQQSWLIINIASISGKQAFANGEFYSASKFAVMWYSQWIRNELKDFGIKVATICPGMVKTDFFDEKELERRMKLWNGKVPQMLEVKDVVDTALLICNQSKDCDIQDIILIPF